MKATFLSLIICLVSLTQLHAQQTPQIAEALPGEFYMVYSQVNSDVNTFAFLTNIFVLKGTNDTVWIFGSGCGDIDNYPADTGDIRYYQFWQTGGPPPGTGSITWQCDHDAIEDAMYTDSVITDLMGLNRGDVKLKFIVPHHHADHAAPEFLVDMIQLGYNIADLEVVVHVNDDQYLNCTVPCCGNIPCEDKAVDPGFGASFDPPWPTNILNTVSQIGLANDQCGDAGRTFTTSYGPWKIVAAPDTALGGHTAGTMDLEHAGYQFRVVGSNFTKYSQCDTTGWTIFDIHGAMPTIPVLPGMTDIEAASYIKVHPNPFSNSTELTFNNPEKLNHTITLLDLLGNRVRVINNVSTNRATIAKDKLAPGNYFVELQSEERTRFTRIVIQ